MDVEDVYNTVFPRTIIALDLYGPNKIMSLQ